MQKIILYETFFSLIKMLYNMCKKSERHPTWHQLEHAIKRNFGGFESQELNPFEIFEEFLKEKHLKVSSDIFSSEVSLLILLQNIHLIFFVSLIQFFTQTVPDWD